MSSRQSVPTSGSSNAALLFTLLVAPLGLIVVLAGALLCWLFAAAEQWLERRSATQYHARRQARRKAEA